MNTVVEDLEALPAILAGLCLMTRHRIRAVVVSMWTLTEACNENQEAPEHAEEERHPRQVR